jgi:hypothetical protein
MKDIFKITETYDHILRPTLFNNIVYFTLLSPSLFFWKMRVIQNTSKFVTKI